MDRPHDAGEAHEAWEDAEVVAAIAWAIDRDQPGLARAIALARWGGFRRGTICALPVASRVTGYDDDGAPHPRIYWMTSKRRVLADKREDARLTALMSSTPNRSTLLAFNADSGAWKERQLSQAVERMVASLAKAGTCRPGLTLHGLRHARGVELALAAALGVPDDDEELEEALDAALPGEWEIRETAE